MTHGDAKPPETVSMTHGDAKPSEAVTLTYAENAIENLFNSCPEPPSATKNHSAE